MYFRLLPEVYLTIGKSKSLLQNILEKKSLWIKNDLAQLLIKSESNRPILKEDVATFKILAEKNWGILSENPIFIDKLRLTNVFNNKRFFKQNPIIQFATLKITDECNLDCEYCNSRFCPMCFHSGISKTSYLSLEQWKIIILKLHRFGCKNIILSGGEAFLYPQINELCQFMLNLDVTPTIYTNGKIKVNLNDNVHIIISINDIKNIHSIIDNYRDKKNVVLLSSFNLEDKIKKIIPSSWKYSKFSLNEPKMTKNNLFNPNIFMYFAQRDNNRCLNNKIAILENGDVYPCFGAYVSGLERIGCTDTNNSNDFYIGNTQQDDWIDIVKGLSENFWNNKIDDDPKCNNCEFRYSCNICLFNDTSKNCFYDKEDATWK